MKWVLAVCVLCLLAGSLLAGGDGEVEPGDDDEIELVEGGGEDETGTACAMLEPSADQMFFGKSRGKVQQLMSDSGRDGWSVSGFVYPQTPAISEKGIVVACKSNYVEGYDARKGKRVWTSKLNDNGPTSPTIHGTTVTVATESCTVYAINANNGKRKWSKWISGHLQTQVSAWEDMYFTTAPNVKMNGDRMDYALLGLVKGKISWAAALPGEAISAPILYDGRVYVSCTDGSLFCHDAKSGTMRWGIDCGAASAPWLDGDRLYVTIPGDPRDIVSHEVLISIEGDDKTTGRVVAERPAQHMDGFDKRRKDLNRTSPGSHGSWSYQGSRPCVVDGRIYATLGKKVECYNAKTLNRTWSATYRDPKKTPFSTTLPDSDEQESEGTGTQDSQAAETVDEKTMPFFTSPAVTNNHLYVGTAKGDLYCLDAKTGKKLFSLKMPYPVVRQPVVRNGYLCVISAGGRLLCIKLDKDYAQDSWYQWGGASSGNAQ